MNNPYNQIRDQLSEIMNCDVLPKFIMITGKNHDENQIALITLSSFGCLYYSIGCVENNLHYSEYPEMISNLKRLSEKYNNPISCVTQSSEFIRCAAETGDCWLLRVDIKDDGYCEIVVYNTFGMQAISEIDYEVRG